MESYVGLVQRKCSTACRVTQKFGGEGGHWVTFQCLSWLHSVSRKEPFGAGIVQLAPLWT